jgi:hypothetical protein
MSGSRGWGTAAGLGGEGREKSFARCAWRAEDRGTLAYYARADGVKSIAM